MTLEEYRNALARLPHGPLGPIGGPVIYRIEMAVGPATRSAPRAPDRPELTPSRPMISAKYELRAMEEARLNRLREDAELRAKLMSRDRQRPSPVGWTLARLS